MADRGCCGPQGEERGKGASLRRAMSMRQDRYWLLNFGHRLDNIMHTGMFFTGTYGRRALVTVPSLLVSSCFRGKASFAVRGLFLGEQGSPATAQVVAGCFFMHNLVYGGVRVWHQQKPTTRIK